MRVALGMALVLACGGAPPAPDAGAPCLTHQDCPALHYCEGITQECPGVEQHVSFPAGHGNCREADYTPILDRAPCQTDQDCPAPASRCSSDNRCSGVECFQVLWPPLTCAPGCINALTSHLMCMPRCVCATCPAPADGAAADSQP